MPAGKPPAPKAPEERRGSATVKRETFRPPWVKEGPDALPPKPSNLWSKNKQASKDGGTSETDGPPRRLSNAKANPPQENGTTPKENTFVKPQLKPVPPREQTKLQSREIKVPVKLNSIADRADRPELKKPPLNKQATINAEEKNIEKAVPTERNAMVRQESLKKLTAPKAPPMPPPAPALPGSTDSKLLSNKQKKVIESLKSRPKVRPDWSAMLKEVESGKKLRHVQCNDRSRPLLPSTKDKEKKQFIYESEKSEKDTSHNQLLKQIQKGISLKKVKTNDRSKPILEGLRKFRRQMTIEEQIIKSQSMASIPPEEIADEADELDDIDKVRDDLQSTKQMLALELRNKECLNRDNKRLQTRIQQLESELDKEKSNKKSAPSEPTETDDKLLDSLKNEADDARKTAEDLEKKYHEAANQLDNTKSELEEVRKQKILLEKRLQDTLTGKRYSISDRKDSFRRDSESEPEEIIPESESDGSDNEEKREKRAQREVKQLRNKLRSFKNKEDNAKKERLALKTQIKRLQQAMKEEKKKYRELKKEVNKMAALMKEVGDDSEEEDTEPEEKEETETETETESESESETSESSSDSEKSVSEPEDAPVDKHKTNLTKRTKKYEGRIAALKKGNYLLKANVERLQDDLNKQKEESGSLQQDLESVLAELG